MTRSALLASAALVAACVACAGPRAATRPPAANELVVREPERVDARVDDDLFGKNDEELFAAGMAASAEGASRRAADAFSRLADTFPSSPRRPAALYDAGLALRALGEWRTALERFRELAERHAGPDAEEARFLVAECHWRLGERAEARRVLDALAARAELDPVHHARALVERGVVEAEDGEPEVAERSLAAGAAAAEAAGREPAAAALLAKAHFWLGELERDRFLGVKLDPSAGDAARLERDLEGKSERLLVAQERYLRAIRTGDATWAVAAGGRIGELYDGLYTELVTAPLPPGLDADASAAYQAELRGRVRVLVTKAIRVYEETLGTARRAGVEGDLVPRIEAALERMRRALAGGDVPAAAGAPRG
ncbi:MAG: tetratricopeptide repeat protein [Anaeromyxobacteraceae bacterium]